MNIKGTNHQHAEAFCHMQYYGSRVKKTNIDGAKLLPVQVSVNVWNSRDGVTPFIMLSKEYAVELQHINWQQDVYDPGYKPKKGDLIWRDYTPAEAEESARKSISMWLEEKKRLEEMTDEAFQKEYKGQAGMNRQALINQLTAMTENPDAFIESHSNELLQRGEPYLELVKEDWP